MTPNHSERGDMLPGARKIAIAKQIDAVGEVTVSQLAETYAVSVDTIRRDLDQLAGEGAVVRTHGGAMSVSSAAPDVGRGLDERRAIQSAAKDRIGRLAAELVHDGDAVMFNGGTTTLAVAAHLTDRRDLVVFTNNLRIPSEIPPRAIRDMYVIGGAVHLTGQDTIGPIEIRSPRPNWVLDVHSDIAFIGVGALDPERGCTVSNLQEAIGMAEMMSKSSRTAIVADSSKFGRNLLASVCDFSRIDYLVTDQMPSNELHAALDAADVHIIA